MKTETIKKFLDLLEDENMSLVNMTVENLGNITKKDKITIKCNNCNSEFTSTYKNFLDNRRSAKLCLLCDSKEKFMEKIKNLYKDIPYEFKSDFKGYYKPLTVLCKSCNTEFSVNKATNLLANHNYPEGTHPCPECSKRRLKNNKNININIFKEKLIEKYGECNYSFPFPEKFNGLYSKSPFLVICNKCGSEIYTLPNNIINADNGKHYCKNCNPSGHGPSKKEEELRDFIKSIIDEDDIIFNSRSILENNLELDIFIKSQNIGIELDGSYWHSEEFKGKNYHLEKTKIANKKGIRLIHIFEDEWTHKKEIVKSKIRNILNVN